MELTDSRIHSFILKIWLEDADGTGLRAAWRGQITHVHGGEQRYVKHLDEILAFIVPYLEGSGIRLGVGWRVLRWLGQWKRRLERS